MEVRDGSVCNHMGNLETLLNLPWSAISSASSAIILPAEDRERRKRRIIEVDYALILQSVIGKLFAEFLSTLLHMCQDAFTDNASVVHIFCLVTKRKSAWLR